LHLKQLGFAQSTFLKTASVFSKEEKISTKWYIKHSSLSLTDFNLVIHRGGHRSGLYSHRKSNSKARIKNVPNFQKFPIFNIVFRNIHFSSYSYSIYLLSLILNQQKPL